MYCEVKLSLTKQKTGMHFLPLHLHLGYGLVDKHHNQPKAHRNMMSLTTIQGPVVQKPIKANLGLNF